MFCKNCGKEVAENEKRCANCGAKMPKPKKLVCKKWWFWVLMGLATLMTIGIISPPDTDFETTSSTQQITQSQGDTQSEANTTQYEKIDLKTMLDELDENALKAEKTYQNKYVEVAGEIVTFDSDGSYISIEPVNADDWNFDTVMCKIKDDAQRDFLLEKSKGDKVTVKGQIVSVGELLGYTIKIHEIH